MIELVRWGGWFLFLLLLCWSVGSLVKIPRGASESEKETAEGLQTIMVLLAIGVTALTFTALHLARVP